jgi:hypothetical protein
VIALDEAITECRGAIDGNDVELGAVPQRIMHDVEARPGPHIDVAARYRIGDLGHRHESALRHIAELVRFAFPAQPGPYHGVQTVGANQGCPFDAAPVGRSNDDAVAAILEVGRRHPRLERDLGACAAGIHQHLVQVDPMDDDIRMPKALPERCAERNACDFLARMGVHHYACIRHIALFENRGGDAQPIKHRHYIGAELNAIADGAELGRLFENAHAAPGAAQCERGGQSAETAADDDDW